MITVFLFGVVLAIISLADVYWRWQDDQNERAARFIASWARRTPRPPR